MHPKKMVAEKRNQTSHQPGKSIAQQRTRKCLQARTLHGLCEAVGRHEQRQTQGVAV
jgi:hypothetical protein